MTSQYFTEFDAPKQEKFKYKSKLKKIKMLISIHIQYLKIIYTKIIRN